METQTIGIKQLYRELEQISEAALKGKSFTVVRNSKPVFKIEPIEKANDFSGRLTMQRIAQLNLKGGPKDLSANMDHYLYGATKK